MVERVDEIGGGNDESNQLEVDSSCISRRVVLETLAGLGIGSAVFCRAVAAQVQTGNVVTGEMIQQAEWISGLELKPEERDIVAPV